MAQDFGLLVARFNTAAPTYTADNDLRELRIDAGGRVHARATDGNDNTISYFAEDDIVGSGAGGDRGVLILGLNSTNSEYEILKVNDDGSLFVSANGGTDISAAADGTGGVFSATDVRGEVALTLNNWVLIKAIPVATGSAHVGGWSFASDKNTIFQLCLINAATSTRADVTKIWDTQMTTSADPGGHIEYVRALDQVGGANIKLAIFAKQIQSGLAGVAWAMINANTTT